MKDKQELKKEVWNKASLVDGYSPDLVRQDACGAYMIFSHFENQKSPFGWEIDYIYPKDALLEKGVDEQAIENIINLRPLQWENKVSKGNSYPSYTAEVIGRDGKYIREQKEFIVGQDTRKELCDYFKIKDDDCEL
ncbi:MAG: hypothetical protein KH425_09705 [Prevotella bivia]|uniref:hypothetical protein n=1 Tax=Prevotella bivia TaxID=28125 RepID=UPI00254A32E1|nr:hypothetical protein [Prevotella bivia]MBS6329802.1 hypothetical protein [Prevotella bivia]MDK7764044.1 hypothetical protein [Prevotella bivia]MDU2114678.1 hypothetical protein [Prevotella bivia]